MGGGVAMFSVGDNFFSVSFCFLGVAFPFVMSACGSIYCCRSLCSVGRTLTWLNSYDR